MFEPNSFPGGSGGFIGKMIPIIPNHLKLAHDHHKDLVKRRHSLAPETVQPPKTIHFLTRNRRSFVFSSSGNAASQIIAIDSKIEQAMDLVKTHLMFAVREEVEILRAKIVELDSTISRLQNENAILREHVPQEILQNLDGSRSLSPTLSNSATSTTNAIVAAQ
uniref:Uncharacterized protein n=1 Tax=Panagrolaimus sp. PS1159 TaxID=55785 RepID=A0AC35FQK2_9BILA